LPETDLQLVDQCLKGEAEAFGLLYDRYISRVYGLLVRLCGNPTQADDLAQETFVTAYRSLQSWRLNLRRDCTLDSCRAFVRTSNFTLPEVR
jgi:RNA polymerase sigma-70 factor (ECF subfamily)